MKRLSADSRIEQVLKRIRSASARSAACRVAERLEHPLHPLGVVLVHLAPEGGDVVALPARQRSVAIHRQEDEMEYETLTYELDDHVAVLTYDRPEQRNAVSGEMNAELHHAWRRFRDDDDAFVLVITGARRARSAPAGTSQDAADWPRPDWDEFRTHVHDSPGDCGYTRRVDVFKPVIAAVNGWAVAAGLENALLADIRIVAEQRRLRRPRAALEHRRRRRDDRAPAAGRRLREGDGADHHRAARSTPRRRCAIGLANEVVARGQGATSGRSSWPTRSPRCPRARSAPTRRRWSATSGGRYEERLRSEVEAALSMFCAATRTRSAPRRSSAARRPSGRTTGSKGVSPTGAPPRPGRSRASSAA